MVGDGRGETPRRRTNEGGGSGLTLRREKLLGVTPVRVLVLGQLVIRCDQRALLEWKLKNIPFAHCWFVCFSSHENVFIVIM